VRVGRSNLLSWRFSPLLQVAELELLRCSRIVLRGHLRYWWRWLSVRQGPLWTSCRAVLAAPDPQQGPYRMAGGLRWQCPLGTNTKLDVTFQAITGPVLYQQTYHWTIPAQGHTHTKDYKYTCIFTHTHSSGAVWESRWTSWAVRSNEHSGFRGRKDLSNRASALVTTCP